MSSNRSSYDPLDPFAEKENIFESKEIRTSKSREAKRRADYLKKKEKTETKAKKPSLLSRIITFFKELPEREDKKKVITRCAIMIISIVVVVFVVLFIIIPLKREKQFEEKAVSISNALNDSVNIQEGKIAYEEDLRTIIEESSPQSTAYGIAILTLVHYLQEDERIEDAIILLEQKADIDSMSNNYRIEALLKLSDLYGMLNQPEKRMETIDSLLQYGNTEEDINIEEGSWREIREELSELYNSLKAQADE